MSKIFGSARSWFLVNGRYYYIFCTSKFISCFSSSGGIISSVLACSRWEAANGGAVVVGDDSHVSVHNAIEIAAVPKFVLPTLTEPNFQISIGLSASAVIDFIGTCDSKVNSVCFSSIH